MGCRESGGKLRPLAADGPERLSLVGDGMRFRGDRAQPDAPPRVLFADQEVPNR